MAYAAVSKINTPPSPALSGTTLSVDEDTGPRYPDVPFDALVWPGDAIPSLGVDAEEVTVTSVVDDDFVIARATDVSQRVEILEDWSIAALRSFDSFNLDEAVSLEYTFAISNPPYHIHTRAPDGVAGSAVAMNAGGGTATYSFDPDKAGTWYYRFAGLSEEGPDSAFYVRHSSAL